MPRGIKDHCGICGKTRGTSLTKRFVQDHDHKTGVVRGKLCDPCNGRLGNYEYGLRTGSFPYTKHYRKWDKRFKAEIEAWLVRGRGDEVGVLKCEIDRLKRELAKKNL